MSATRPTKAERRRIGRSIRKARRERALVERFVLLGAGGAFAAAEKLMNIVARFTTQTIPTFESFFLTYRALDTALDRPTRGASVVQVWHDEAQRYEATGRLDEGPCWCQECVQTELDRGETEQQA